MSDTTVLPKLSDLFVQSTFEDFEYKPSADVLKSRALVQKAQKDALIAVKPTKKRRKLQDGSAAGVVTTTGLEQLAERTRFGLQKAGFVYMTQVQAAMLPIAMCGENLLVQAVTGAGKTLGFIIPVIERLVSKGYEGGISGLGALIVLPTRELASQVWDVLQSVGRGHNLSAGCLVGGMKFDRERQHLDGTCMNIVIGTPGRIVHHMEASPTFDVGACEIVVIDEVDRLLDAKFLPQIRDILHNHGNRGGNRQIILCSATAKVTPLQMKKLKLHKTHFHRIELENEGLSATADSKAAVRLRQWLAVTSHEHKLDALVSFIAAHRREKMIIFTETCKMVSVISDVLRVLLPKLKILTFHGRATFNQRLDGFDEFNQLENSGVLVSTDLAERGVDIKNLKWVVQFDVPNNVETYIHRIGRTARLNASGDSLIFATPAEQQFIRELVKETGFKLHIYRFAEPKLATSSIKQILAKDEAMRAKVDKAMISILKSQLGTRYYNPQSIHALAQAFGMSSNTTLSFIPEKIKEKNKTLSATAVSTISESEVNSQ